MIEAEIRQLTPQPTAAVRLARPMDQLDLAALFDELLPAAGLSCGRAAGAATPVRPGECSG